MKIILTLCALILVLTHAHGRASSTPEHDANIEIALYKSFSTTYTNDNNKEPTIGVSDYSTSHSKNQKVYRTTEGGWFFSPDSPLNQRGRVWLITATTAKSAYIFPEMYSFALDGLQDRTRTGLTLFSIGATLFGTYGLTKDLDIGYGSAALMNYGATLGYYYPLQLSILLHHATSIDRQTDSTMQATNSPSILPSEKIRAWATLLSVPYGIYAGWRGSNEQDLSFGEASVMIYFSQTLGSIGYALPLLRWDPSLKPQRDDYYTASSALSMAMVPIGMAMGRKLSEHYTFSSGSGIMLYITGALGAATGYLLPEALGFTENLSKEQDRNMRIGATTAGFTLGNFIGLHLNHETGVTFRQSIFMGGSAVAGGLIGASIPYLADVNKESTYILAAMAGAWLGLAIGNDLSQKIKKDIYADENTSITMTLPASYNLPLILASGNDSGDSDNFQYPLVNLNVRF